MNKYSSSSSSSSSPFQSHSYDANSMPSSLSVISRISPLILLVIIVLAVIFFAYGVVHLVLWFFLKALSSSSSSSLLSPSLYNSNRFHRESWRRSRALQRQLHHLFRMHDSGLEQSIIDALPVFYYQDLLGVNKEPFDCAVCLCEFSHEEKLRLVPICSHAFHMNCLDTWLLSNSTCPLCRATLSSSNVNQNQNQNQNPSVVLFRVEEENKNNGDEGRGVSKRVLSVRLGKLRNSGLSEREESSSSSSSLGLDGRRCYSMGSYEYVVRESNNVQVQVVLSQSLHHHQEEGEEEEGKKIGNKRRRGESFSVSKIWQWSNKIKYNNNNNNHGSDADANADFPL